MAEHNDLGRKGEDKAVEYLIQKGFVILERNWRLKHWELDVICQKDRWLVVVEVKTRELPVERPDELLDFRKRQNIRRAADAYVKMSGCPLEVRFDLVLVIGTDMHIQHIE